MRDHPGVGQGRGDGLFDLLGKRMPLPNAPLPRYQDMQVHEAVVARGPGPESLFTIFHLIENGGYAGEKLSK